MQVAAPPKLKVPEEQAEQLVAVEVPALAVPEGQGVQVLSVVVEPAV